MKISLLLPYWNRQEAANKGLESLRQYKYLDLEIIVVDDGSHEPFVAPEGLPIRVITLPRKDEPKSPVTPWNVAAKAATGDVLVLSCIEVVHIEPVLEELALAATGDNYVMAAAWCPEENRWHTHTSVDVPDCPPGSGLGFCAALTPELYWRAGGWDEAYRDGAGYEDRDWIRRLHVVGTNFVKRDDLIVMHPKTGATIAWGQEKFERNLALYRLKWPTQSVTFVCLNAGNYCGMGAEYVNRLADMVKRNMPFGTRWRFVCLTDDPNGYDDGVEILPLPSDLKGWWGKLYLFKPGLFPDGERVVFFDLDTLIVGSLENVLSYKGDMAILRDFYMPRRGAPGVILWRAGFGERIWTEWEAQGRPENPLGDLGWIENLDQGRFTRHLDRLQDLFPAQFVSYKAHCHPYPPEGTKVVCFHGQPKPHNCDSKWVDSVWSIGGGKVPVLTREINTAQQVIRNNIASATARDLPWLDMQPAHERTAILVGGGPSLKRSLDFIRNLNGDVFALNNAATFLIKNGIRPEWQVFLDARPGNVDFIADAKRHLVSSTCVPQMFDELTWNDVTVYHPNTPGMVDALGDRKDKPIHLIGGGSTVGLLALSIAYVMGYRRFELFGYDSSYEDGDHHAYSQSLNDGEVCVDVICEGRKFRCAAWMATQAQEFQEVSTELAQLGCEISVHGQGLLPYLAWQMTKAA